MGRRRDRRGRRDRHRRQGGGTGGATSNAHCDTPSPSPRSQGGNTPHATFSADAAERLRRRQSLWQRLWQQGFEAHGFERDCRKRWKRVKNFTLRLCPAEVDSRRQQYLAQEQKQTLTYRQRLTQRRACTVRTLLAELPRFPRAPERYWCPIGTHWSCKLRPYPSEGELEVHITSTHSKEASSHLRTTPRTSSNKWQGSSTAFQPWSMTR